MGGYGRWKETSDGRIREMGRYGRWKHTVSGRIRQWEGEYSKWEDRVGRRIE